MGKHGNGPRHENGNLKSGPRPDITIKKSPHSHRDGKPADSKVGKAGK